jgi:diguanylate cyclase (GGDEF)-like protein/PAS domain S-box-containing protein
MDASRLKSLWRSARDRVKEALSRRERQRFADKAAPGAMPHGRAGRAGDGTSDLLERIPAITYVAEPGANGRWHYVSPRIQEMLGYSQEEWLADPGLWARCIHPEDRAAAIREEERDIKSGSGAPQRTEYRMVGRDGRVRWVIDEASLRTSADGRLLYDGLLIDITEHKWLESRLKFLADHDPLTNLWNRRRFMEELAAEIKRVRRHGQPASFLMLDLDNLKAVNDSLGHRVGDQLIRATARALTERLRETDAVARLGGDEFAVLLRGTGGDRAEAVARELVEAVEARTRELPELEVPAAISVGIADIRPESQSIDRIVDAADLAMYEAKRGKGAR